MNLEKTKKMLKNRRVQIISGTVAGALLLTVAGTIILNNNNLENKNIVVEADDKKPSNKESNEIKEQLEELKSMDTSNMSDEEKKELENKIADTEKKVANNNEASKEVTLNTSTSKQNSTSTTIENSGTSTNTNKGSNSNSKPSSGSSSNSNSSNNTGSSTSGSTGGNTSNKEESHTHNWVPITSVVHHDEQGHNEKILVSEAWTEEIPIYEDKEVAICNGCGADITSDPWGHREQHALAGNYSCGGFRTDWKQVQVGTNKINHDAVYEDKWVVDKAAWDETITTGYKCSSCGATK